MERYFLTGWFGALLVYRDMVLAVYAFPHFFSGLNLNLHVLFLIHIPFHKLIRPFRCICLIFSEYFRTFSVTRCNYTGGCNSCCHWIPRTSWISHDIHWTNHSSGDNHVYRAASWRVCIGSQPETLGRGTSVRFILFFLSRIHAFQWSWTLPLIF